MKKNNTHAQIGYMLQPYLVVMAENLRQKDYHSLPLTNIHVWQTFDHFNLNCSSETAPGYKRLVKLAKLQDVCVLKCLTLLFFAADQVVAINMRALQLNMTDLIRLKQ